MKNFSIFTRIFFQRAQAQNPFIFKYFSPVRQSSRKTALPDYIKLNNIIKFTNLDNDCLLLAEGIISGNLEKPEYNIAKLRVKERDAKNRLLGHSDKQNIQIAKDIRASYTEQDLNALNPGIMEAYSMLPIVLPADATTCPYHAAAVIFKDGNSNITLEADAGLGGLKKPVFDIYYTNEPSLSFYQRYKDMYTVNRVPPVAAVLYSRDKVSPKKKTASPAATSSPKKKTASPAATSSPKKKTRSRSRSPPSSVKKATGAGIKNGTRRTRYR